jgi:hypothetical protein
VPTRDARGILSEANPARTGFIERFILDQLHRIHCREPNCDFRRPFSALDKNEVSADNRLVSSFTAERCLPCRSSNSSTD